MIRLKTNVKAREFTHIDKLNRRRSRKEIHLAYLFASPLVIDLNKEKPEEDKLDEISFKEEFQEIIRGLQDDGLALRYRYQMATH